MTTFFKDKHFIVTGGAGMIGSELCQQLLDRGAKTVTAVDNLSRGRKEFIPLRTTFSFRDLTRERPPKYSDTIHYCFHLAAEIGGVGKMHSEQYASGVNLLIDRNVFEFCRLYNIPLYYQSTACIFPVTSQTQLDSATLLHEDMAFPANCESVYGWAKLIGELQAQALHREYKIPVSIGRSFNVVGPHEADTLAHSHVVPALIQKILIAARDKSPSITVWGTGNQERSFLYVSDAAAGILHLAEHQQDAQPINLGMPVRYTIKSIAQMLINIALDDLGIISQPLTIEFDLSKPEGVFTRAADISKAEALGWSFKNDILPTLRKTFKWWMEKGWDIVNAKT